MVIRRRYVLWWNGVVCVGDLEWYAWLGCGNMTATRGGTYYTLVYCVIGLPGLMWCD